MRLDADEAERLQEKVSMEAKKAAGAITKGGGGHLRVARSEAEAEGIIVWHVVHNINRK